MRGVSSRLLTIGVASIGIVASSMLSSVLAQEESELLGYWKQRGSSIYIQFTDNEGTINAEMIRNDWSPGLVGEMVFQNVTSSKKNRWDGEAFVAGSDKLGKVRITLNREGRLETRVRPGARKKAEWIKSEPVEKRL